MSDFRVNVKIGEEMDQTISDLRVKIVLSKFKTNEYIKTRSQISDGIVLAGNSILIRFACEY